MMTSNDSTPNKKTNIADASSNVSQQIHVHGQGQIDWLSRYEQKIEENILQTVKISQLEKDLEKANEFSEQTKREIEQFKEQSVKSDAREEQLFKENRLLEEKIEKLEVLQEKDSALLAKKDEEIEELKRQLTDGSGSKVPLLGAQGTDGGAVTELSVVAICSDRSFEPTRALKDVKINLLDRDGKGYIFLKTCRLEEKIWTVKCKTGVRGDWCSFFDGKKTIILKERLITLNLILIDSETGNILKDLSFVIDFTPFRMFVKSDTAFILGENAKEPFVV